MATSISDIRSFQPIERTLMGPGPSDISPQVLQALSRPTLGHLDPLFIAMMDEVKQLLQYAFQTENPFTIAVSAPGSAGMEACFVNLVEPGDTVIVCRNGVFGDRMRENVERCGAHAVMVDDAWGEPVSPDKVEAALKAHPEASIVAFVHAETSTGACSDAQTLATLAREHGCLTIVDAVTSLGGVPLKVDEWQLDAVYSGSQKCLSCVPGLSPVTFSARAVEKMQARTHKVQSWFLDQSLVLGYWSGDGKRSYHHTAPVNSLYALHESLLKLYQEGIENAWQRHQTMHQRLKAGLDDLGIRFVVDEPYRLPQLNAVYIPDGVDDGAVRQHLLNTYNLEIGAGLGDLAGKAWRIGLMGYSAREENIALCLKALGDALR
ncbi:MULTISPECIES: pyridoxal-phosphate-dependent aminotransferase family protein [Salinivibrio]|uniref:pyridoxal-phosphate-dependent aminotransferase family protein n=1 Tax=Salinivibrio TaxID=51366 RepID=UPI00098743C2|nr:MULTISPECIES: alanine--glyoxylate aminotransferase family protein [Salinivibrio]OOF09397.1 alanine--glyoxylate aminotransferase [Salinivibrio sp. PR919]OOF12443.1 alanine--glyoxylate aminotransferase [Salinivibrio sp. PR5]OOF13893.1 alanine--glyoxylate aminotransferase [Salinivibrio sp. PR932]OOF31612.1 alanine--glyoxylate aminotransferase [Salinivibrio proteolyticus]